MHSTYFETFIDAFAGLTAPLRILDGDTVLCPPSEDFGYQSTPKNAITFADMGVDGVHYAILKLEGAVRDDSPVIYVSPMDSDDITVLGESLVGYLADGCGVCHEEMKMIFEADRAGKPQLVAFLTGHFRHNQLLEEQRTEKLNARYGHLVQRKAA
jgi:hypothetical protein